MSQIIQVVHSFEKAHSAVIVDMFRSNLHSVSSVSHRYLDLIKACVNQMPEIRAKIDWMVDAPEPMSLVCACSMRDENCHGTVLADYIQSLRLLGGK